MLLVIVVMDVVHLLGHFSEFYFRFITWGFFLMAIGDVHGELRTDVVAVRQRW